LPNSAAFVFRFYQACTPKQLIATEGFAPILKQENFLCAYFETGKFSQACFFLNCVSVSVDTLVRLILNLQYCNYQVPGNALAGVKRNE